MDLDKLKEELQYLFKDPKVYHCVLTREELRQIYFEIERLNNIIDELDNLISIKIQRQANEDDYQIDINDLVEIKMKLLELKGSDSNE